MSFILSFRRLESGLIFHIKVYGLELDKVLAGLKEAGSSPCTHRAIDVYTIPGNQGAAFGLLKNTHCNAERRHYLVSAYGLILAV